MKYVYIGGDSFCFHRNNETTTWPAILAKKLNLELEGIGFPGVSWWNSREHLLKYKQTSKFTNTEYFLFVHTDPSRILTNYNVSQDLPDDVELEVKKTYFKYIENKSISIWTMKSWFIELNHILQDKKVVHLFGFHEAALLYGFLIGLKFNTPLIQLSLSEPGITMDNFIIDSRLNHFSIDSNIKLASEVYNGIERFYVLNETTSDTLKLNPKLYDC
jgi:hypothetical protein